MLRHACPCATFNDSKSSVDLFFLAVRREALSARCPARVCVCAEVVVQRASDESDLSHYVAYWGAGLR